MTNPRSLDTSGTAAALQTQILRRMTGAERLRLAVDLSLTARALSMARLRSQHPTWSDSDLKRELLRYAFLPDPPPDAYR